MPPRVGQGARPPASRPAKDEDEMKYRFEHEFPCDRETLIRTMFEKDVIESLKGSMPHLAEGESLDWKEAGSRIQRRVRYRPVPKIESVGPKKVEPRWMEWIEESEVDVQAGRGTYRNVPTTEKIAELLKNHGELTFTQVAPGRTVRVMSGELKVHVFLLGAVAERVIHGYAREILDEEAAALARLIRSRDA